MNPTQQESTPAKHSPCVARRGLAPRRPTLLSAAVPSCAAALFFSFWTSLAEARPQFYDVLAELGTCDDCRLCHTTAQGTATTVDTESPFYLQMTLAGKLTVADPQPPDPLMDSDGDGFTDVQELQEFGDPNDPMVGPGQFDCPGADYGCARIAKPPVRSDALTWGAGLLVALLLTRRRR